MKWYWASPILSETSFHQRNEKFAKPVAPPEVLFGGVTNYLFCAHPHCHGELASDDCAKLTLGEEPLTY